MKQITVRGVPKHIAKALEKEKQRRGTSLNQTILDLLGQSLGVKSDSTYDNGLSKLAGTWSQSELKSFEQHTSIFGRIDKLLWR